MCFHKIPCGPSMMEQQETLKKSTWSQSWQDFVKKLKSALFTGLCTSLKNSKVAGFWQVSDCYIIEGPQNLKGCVFVQEGSIFSQGALSTPKSPKWHHNGSKMSQKWGRRAQRAPKVPPKSSQCHPKDSPSTFQSIPKSLPKPETRPKASPRPPRGLSD